VKQKNLFWEGEREKRKINKEKEEWAQASAEGRLEASAPRALLGHPFPMAVPAALPLMSSTSDLGCTAQVVIVHLFDGLEVDDTLQLRLMLICKGIRVGLRRPKHRAPRP
jgi:hypothetical protein